jgi:hypothetical protein
VKRARRFHGDLPSVVESVALEGKRQKGATMQLGNPRTGSFDPNVSVNAIVLAKEYTVVVVSDM